MCCLFKGVVCFCMANFLLVSSCTITYSNLPLNKSLVCHERWGVGDLAYTYIYIYGPASLGTPPPTPWLWVCIVAPQYPPPPLWCGWWWVVVVGGGRSCICMYMNVYVWYECIFLVFVHDYDMICIWYCSVSVLVYAYVYLYEYVCVYVTT